jgi:hypothetical protein
MTDDSNRTLSRRQFAAKTAMARSLSQVCGIFVHAEISKKGIHGSAGDRRAC